MGPSSKQELMTSTNGAFTSYNQFKAGTSGAVPSSFTRARDLQSVTKVSTTYVLKFNRGATALLDWSIKVIQASYSKTGGACRGDVTVDDIAGSTKSITVTFYDGDGDAVALAEGDVARLNFTLKTSPGQA